MENITFKLPDLGEGVVEAEIVAWHVRPGEQVRVDQPLVDVMTDKATVTIPSGHVDRVVRTHGNVGDTVAVGAELVSFDTSSQAVMANAVGATIDEGPRTILRESPMVEPVTVPLVQRAVRPAETARPVVPAQASPAVR